jgi:hypothetical protein
MTDTASSPAEVLPAAAPQKSVEEQSGMSFFLMHLISWTIAGRIAKLVPPELQDTVKGGVHAVIDRACESHLDDAGMTVVSVLRSTGAVIGSAAVDVYEGTGDSLGEACRWLGLMSRNPTTPSDPPSASEESKDKTLTA